MANTRRETTYERWLQQEGLPVARGYSVADVRALELAPWPRRGGRGAYIQLDGMEGLTGTSARSRPGAHWSRRSTSTTS
jgi:hypothetical protein